jgi:hypothetical protein
MNKTHLTSLALILAVAGVGCGGSDAPNTPNPVPSTGANPAPQTTPKPSPTPTPDPRTNLAPGPIVRFTHKPRIAGPDVREAEQDNQGRYVVYVGERVDFDGTQKNAGNEICKWVNEPAWLVNGREMAFDSSNGVVTRRGSSQPFLLKLTIERPGTFTVQGQIDGVMSNILEMKSVAR